jgi:protein kinase C substrate 80K-H
LSPRFSVSFFLCFSFQGTSACNNGQFYCTNERSLPKTIFSSRVDDGICDCCDGSDETKTPEFECPNTCAEEGETLKKGLRAHVSIMERAILDNRAKIAEFRFISETCDNREENTIEMQALTKQLQKMKKKFVADEANIKEATEEFKKKNGVILICGFYCFLTA